MGDYSSVSIVYFYKFTKAMKFKLILKYSLKIIHFIEEFS